MKEFRQKIFSVIAAAALISGSIPSISSVFAASEDNISSLTLQPGTDTSAVNVTWYAEGTTDNVVPKIKLNGIELTEQEATVSNTTATTSKTNDYAAYVICKTEVENLAPNTTYTYQLSNDNGMTWSKEYTYKTPAEDTFRFAFTSDPQIKESGETNNGGWNPSDGKNQTGWQVMMETISNAGATLVVSAGDQVEDQSWGKKTEYDAFFAPEEMSSIAYAPAVGNHDRHYMFRDHFNLPNEMEISEEETDDKRILTEIKTTFRGQNNGTSLSHGNYTKATEDEVANQKNEKGVTPNSDGIYDYVERREMETEGNYYYLYNNVLFVTLNTGAYPGGNDALEGENTTLDSAKAENEATGIVNNFRKTLTAATEDYNGQYNWIVVTHHKSTQTVAKHAADSDIENYVDAGFEQLMEDFDVDFVLGGHDHVYSRSYVLNGKGERMSKRLDTINDPDGTIYLTGNCASDMQYYTPFASVDKQNNADYPKLANGEMGSAAYLKGQNAENPSDYLPIGNQEYNQEYSPSYVIFDVTDNTITAKAYNLAYGEDGETTSDLIDSFIVTKNTDGGTQSKGFENEKSSLNAVQLSRYDSNMTNADGGVMEIVDYNTKTGWAYAINGQTGNLTAIPLDKVSNTGKVELLDGNDIDIKSLVEEDGFIYGDMTSVAVSPDNTMLAAAVQAAGYNDNGRAVIFNCNNDGTLTFVRTIETGVQPDMITFTPDGTKILTANEGEPREGYEAPAVDPEGSVTIIDTASWTATNAGFASFNHDTLAASGVVLKKGATPSADLEPEYIAANNEKAYVTLQEANSVAVLDLETKAFTGVYSLGTVDYSTVKIDLSKADEDANKKYSPDNYKNVFGLRMADGISTYQSNGKTYIVTANEGDSREWGSYINESEGKLTSVSGIETDKKVTFLDTSDYDGIEEGKTYLFGSRSVTVFEVTDSGVVPVFDSGADFEEKTAAYLPDYFNTSNDSIEIDDRSNKKGPEAESVTIGTVGDKTYAFVTLERIGGIMIYDITNCENIKYVNYINSRDFSTELGVDNSPEGLKFITPDDSPTGNALLLAACEVGGTVAVYELAENSENDYNIEISNCTYNAENKKLTASINISEADENNKSAVLAIYDSYNNLINLITTNKVFNQTGSDTVEFDVSSLQAGEYKYQVMIWNNFSNVIPQAKAFPGLVTITQ